MREFSQDSLSVATKCDILKLKCNKFNFSWGSAPDPAGGAYSSPLDLLALAGFKGPTSRRGKDMGCKGREGVQPPINKSCLR